MDLWIRSQNKMRIAKVKDVSILTFDDVFSIHGYISDNTHFWLATYKTKERALEVLDEIQIHIEKQGQTIVITNEKGIADGLKYYGKTYVMPKE